MFCDSLKNFLDRLQHQVGNNLTRSNEEPFRSWTITQK